MNALKLTLAAVLVAVNAFFVIAEYALVRSRRSRLEVMRDEGSKGAALALTQLAMINEYISAVQIGVTMTSIGVGAPKLMTRLTMSLLSKLRRTSGNSCGNTFRSRSDSGGFASPCSAS